ncbi:MAG: FAD-dependent oxidoreductase, partial [Gammaproteobacteria bacterium]|nr:FAD-dependent oxidoreductase [Gammaproteobacteria bacterium]
KLVDVPDSIAIIGAGVIGLELGSVWHRLGSKVSIFEPAGGLLLQADPVIARQAKSIFTKQGLSFHFDCQVDSCEFSSGQVKLKYTQKDKTGEEFFDKVLVSIGRRPNTTDLVSSDCKLALTESGQIKVDQYCMTNIPGVYAIGDAVRGPMLAHKSSEEGIMVAEHIAGHAHSLNYDIIPYIIYTRPEIAWCGKTETELKAAKVDYKTGSFPFAANGRAHAGGEAQGVVKVLSDAKTDRILGVHMIGPHVSELIQQAVIAMEFKASSEDLAQSIFAHPTLSESLHEAMLDVHDIAIHKSRS